MKLHKREQDVLKKIFQQAYYEKETVTVGNHWQHKVMRRIRNLEPAESGAAFFIRLEQFVWRLTPAVCLMIVILAMVLYHFEVFPEYGVIQALANGEEELTISQIVEL